MCVSESAKKCRAKSREFYEWSCVYLSYETRKPNCVVRYPKRNLILKVVGKKVLYLNFTPLTSEI